MTSPKRRFLDRSGQPTEYTQQVIRSLLGDRYIANEQVAAATRRVATLTKMLDAMYEIHPELRESHVDAPSTAS